VHNDRAGDVLEKAFQKFDMYEKDVIHLDGLPAFGVEKKIAITTQRVFGIT
jgi:hypothetical protein